jgi:hypothetical protein
MATSKGFNDEIKSLQAEPIQGVAAGDLGPAVLTTQGKNVDVPLRMYASSTPDAFLNFSSSVTLMGDGAFKQVPPISSLGVPTISASTINLGTGAVTGGTFTIGGVAFATAFAALTKTSNQFRRFAFAIQASGTVACAASAEAASQGALSDYGVLVSSIGGLPVGYIDVQWITAATQYKTAGAGTNVIQNAGIFRLPLGSGGSGSGSVSSVLVKIQDELVDSPYGFVTPSIYSIDGSGKISSVTGAAYDLATNTLKFTANAQVATSTNLLDVAEFLPLGLDVPSIDLTVFWDRGQTSQAFSVPSAFTYEVSRDGGTNYTTLTMTRVGTTDVFRSNLTFATESTQQSLATQTGSTLNRDLAQSSSDQQLSQSFVVPAGQTWVITKTILNVTKTGTPGGNLYVSLVNNSGGVPSALAADVLGQSSAVVASSLTTGANTVVLPNTVLVAGTYHVVVSSDAAYKATGTFASNKIQLQDASTLSGESTYNGTSWTTQASRGLIYTLQGRSLDVRLRITSAGSPTYPCGLDGFGLFYSLNNVGLVGATKKTQRFVFNSTVDNTSSFAITGFSPDPDLLSFYHVETGQVYKIPAFNLNGTTATFAANTFNNGGVSTTVTLIADQNSGGAMDNSDSNGRLLSTNHLGSTSGLDDKSTAGRGIILRNAAGVLREIALDANDNIIIISVP